MWNYLDIGIIFCYTNACIFRTVAGFVDPAFKNWKNDANWSNRGYSIYQTCDRDTGMASTENGPVSCDFNNYCPLLMGKDDGTDFLFTALLFHSVTFVLLCFKFANSLSISRSMGPLIIIIIKMMQDMIRFLLLLVVMIVGFGVTSNALLYPNHWDGWKSMYSAIYRAYYAIYGELQIDEHSYDKFQAKSVKFELLKVNDTQYNWATHLDEVYLERGCYTVFTKPSDLGKNLDTYEQTDYEAILRCPQGRGFVDIFLGIYMLFTNILLLNLLIALFTTTYEIAMRNADQIWKFQRTGLVKEYRDRPTLPPPLILIPYRVIGKKINKK